MTVEISREPIAVIGMGCRLPGGVRSPSGFWEFLKSGHDGVTEVPTSRWNSDAYYSTQRAHAGKVISRKGGFLDGVDLFEPGFFGISETEAPYIDPQQRLLLEVTWEAFERAGLVMQNLRGQPVGVFIGCFTADYLHIQFANPYEVAAYTATGAIATMVAARLSHAFDFRGPSLVVDTACSSSLHSVHLACESLRAGDSDLAVAGGSQLSLIPEFNIAETKGGFLSDCGECRTFDAGARGYVRSEGIGVVVLKRLRDAVAAGDPIECVILGSALNQDGRTPSISQPNGAAQEFVMRKACSRAGIAPAAIGYVEAHGTGTSAGDRAEAEAIGNVFRVEPDCSSELLVGSCKSNIGHTEAAAGICGLMKAALCVKHQAVPPNLHFETPNPAIGFEHLRIRVPVALTPLADNPALACVSSFGFGGSNAAVIIRGPLEHERPRPGQGQRHTFVLPLSARSAAALQGSASRLAAWLTHLQEAVRAEDLCHTAGVRRAHHEHRRALAFTDMGSLRKQLDSFSGGNSAAAAGGTGTVWVFSGAGNQRFQTGLALFRDEAVFRDKFEQCDAIYRKLAGFSLIESMRSRPHGELIQEAWIAHPVMVSIQLGLGSLFRSWGVKPAAIVGHSLGENAAFHAAGIYDIEQTLQLVFHRCECLKPLYGTGGLLAVAADEDTVRTAMDANTAEIAVAALNGPTAITLSGRSQPLARARERLNAAGIRAQLLSEPYACHHRYPALEAAAQELERRIQKIEARHPEIPLYSTVTGAAMNGAPTSSYWAQHLLESVKLRPVIATLAKLGHQRFLELGPHAALSAAIGGTCSDAMGAKNRARVFGSLSADRDESSSLLNSLGGLYECGEQVDWSALYPRGDVLDLPSYPWQRRPYWREPPQSLQHRSRPESSRLLGERAADGRTAWRAEVSVERFPYLLDHRIAGEALFPAAGFIDMALCAGREHFADYPFVIEELQFLKAIPLSRNSAFFAEFQLDESNASFSISATQTLTSPSAQRVAQGKMRCLPPGISGQLYPTATYEGAPPVSGEDLYERFAKRQYDYRGAFRGIRQAWVEGNEAYCEIESPDAADAAGYTLHPAVLDSAFQALLCIAADGSRTLEIPDRIGSIRVVGVPTQRMFVWARVRDTVSGSLGELCIFDDARRLVAHIVDFVTRRAARGGRSRAPAGLLDRCVYRTEWRRDEERLAAKAPESNTAWVILSGAGDTGSRMARQLAKLGASRVLLGSFEDSAAILAREQRIAGVIHLQHPASSGRPNDAITGCGDTLCASLLNLARTLSRRGDDNKLWVITCGAHQLKRCDPPADMFQACSWGLMRAIGQREMPRIWGGLIDLSRDCLQSEMEACAASIVQPDGEDQLAFRGRERFLLRLRRMTSKQDRAPRIAFRHDGAYVVTGAFGALGGEVARWMAARGARWLILPARRAGQAQNSPLVRELEAAGATIEAPALDLSNGQQVSEYFDRRQKEHGPTIRGVIYCAGSAHDQLAAATDNALFDRVFDSKAAGAWALHESLRDAPLEHFVLFGSAASLLPNPGMGAYAAGNGFLDALASHRRSMGLPGLSIGWGPWEIGMTERSGVKEYLDLLGFRFFDAARGLQLLEHLWHSEYPEPIALSADWERLLGQGQMALPILKELRAEVQELETLKHDPVHETRTQILSAGQHLQSLLARLISTPSQPDMTGPLIDQGLDSLGAMVLAESIYREFGVNVRADAFSDGLSLQDLLELVGDANSPRSRG